MFKPGRKNKQFFRFLFPNHIQIFKKMIEYSLAYQYQPKIDYSNWKALIFNFSILIFNNIYIYSLLATARLLYKLKQSRIFYQKHKSTRFYNIQTPILTIQTASFFEEGFL